jgi:hypothetical protein
MVPRTLSASLGRALKRSVRNTRPLVCGFVPLFFAAFLKNSRSLEVFCDSCRLDTNYHSFEWIDCGYGGSPPRTDGHRWCVD